MSFPSDQGRNENRPMMFDGWGYVPLTADNSPGRSQRPPSPRAKRVTTDTEADPIAR